MKNIKAPFAILYTWGKKNGVKLTYNHDQRDGDYITASGNLPMDADTELSWIKYPDGMGR